MLEHLPGKLRLIAESDSSSAAQEMEIPGAAGPLSRRVSARQPRVDRSGGRQGSGGAQAGVAADRARTIYDGGEPDRARCIAAGFYRTAGAYCRWVKIARCRVTNGLYDPWPWRRLAFTSFA